MTQSNSDVTNVTNYQCFTYTSHYKSQMHYSRLKNITILKGYCSIH